MSAFAYLFSVVLVNVGFVHMPQLAILWSVIVGGCFVLRDWCQHEYGHWSLGLMGIACVISFWLASPQVAIASAAAFGISEGIDCRACGLGLGRSASATEPRTSS